MKKFTGLTFFLFFLLFLFFMGAIGYFAGGKDDGALTGFSGKKKIAVVDLLGVFNTEKSGKILKLLHGYRKDSNVAAVVIRIDSGGGGVAAAQELMAEVIKLKNAGKKVVVSMGEVAASGGYYVACAADKIFANPGTLTGSIGVIMEVSNVEGLFQKIGLKTQVVKSGEFKDIGNPTREMTAKEKELLQGMIDDVYEQFVMAISKGRGLAAEEVRKIADGRVFSGKMALDYGLVDVLGDLDDAVMEAERLAGIVGKSQVIKEEIKKGIFIPLPMESWFGKILNSNEYAVRLSYIFK